MRFIIPIGLTILLASCAGTTNYYSQTVQSWQGSNVQNLTQRWGRPDNIVRGNDGKAVYVYKTESYRVAYAPTAPAVGVNVKQDGKPVITTHPMTNMNGSRMSLNCMALFSVNGKGTITNTQIQGNGCYGSSSFANRLANPTVKVTGNN